MNLLRVLSFSYTRFELFRLLSGMLIIYRYKVRDRADTFWFAGEAKRKIQLQHGIDDPDAAVDSHTTSQG
jgi:hypothetical protein